MNKTFKVGLIVILLTVFITGFFVSKTEAQSNNISLPLCSSTVHDKYKAVGPDNQLYPTWHPQIDLANGCYFDHEHGSSPFEFSPGAGYYYQGLTTWPLFGYTANKSGMTEGHNGFKNYVFDMGGYKWMITHHFGTGNPSLAACNRFHTFDVQVRSLDTDSPTNSILYANIHIMGDFGPSVYNLNPSVRINSPNCPENLTIVSNGVRQLPVFPNPSSYEPWRIFSGANVFGFDGKGTTINTLNPVKGCFDITCESNSQMYSIGGTVTSKGTQRTILIYTGFGFGSGNRDIFYTDGHGNEILNSEDPGAVQQYIKDGFTFSLPATVECSAEGMDYIYLCSTNYVNDLRPKVDAIQFLKNIFVTGNN